MRKVKTLAAYEALAMRTENMKRTPQYRMLAATLGLAGEVGEFVEMVKKKIFHRRPMDRTKALKELGDVLWYLTAAARSLDSSLEEVARINVAKLEERFPDGVYTRARFEKRVDERPR